MEMIDGDGLVRGTYHWSRTNTSGDDQQTPLPRPSCLTKDFGDSWHEFAVEYDGVSGIKFALDGHVYKHIDKYININTPSNAAQDATLAERLSVV